MEITISDQIRLIQAEIGVEKDPERKADLQARLKKLQLKKEIEQIKNQMKQLSK